MCLQLSRPELRDDFLSGVNFSVAGLGSSAYSTFCVPGKALDARLEQLGATRLVR